MPWIARDKNERLYIYSSRPERKSDEWEVYWADAVELPSDADEKLIGKHIDWNNEPVKIN